MHVVRPEPERENMHILNRRPLAVAIAALIGGLLLGSGLTLAFTSSSSTTGAMPVTAAPIPKVVYQCKPNVPVGDARCASETAIKLVADSPGDEYDTRYECANGYESVDTPIGHVVSRFGTSFDLDASVTDYGAQESVAVKVKVAKNVEVGGTIITTAAHDRAPTLYPQYKLDVVVTDGTASFTLQSSAYAQNYYEEGISHLTFCLRKIA